MRLLNVLFSRRASQDVLPPGDYEQPLPVAPRGSESHGHAAAPQGAMHEVSAPSGPSPSPWLVAASSVMRPWDARRLAAFAANAPGNVPTLRKQKLPQTRYAHLHLSLRVVQCIEGETGQVAYTTTPSRVRGSYAKVKAAINPQGEGVCIKELRLASEQAQSKPVTDRDGLPKTRAVTPGQALVEVEATRHLRGLIDADLAHHSASRGGHDPLGMLRTKLTPFEVHGTFMASDKLHMVTTLESGDVCQLQQYLPQTLRQALSWSVGAQIADELAAIFHAGFVHLDVKLENFLFSRWGQIKLADWMTADTLDTSGLSTPARGITGSLPTPDMVRMPQTRRLDGSWRPHKLSSSVDTWQLGVALLRLLVDSERTSPFFWPAHQLRREDVASMREHLVDFEDWRRSAFDADDQFVSQALSAHNMFARYLQEAYDQNPKMVVYLLQHVLIADSQARAKAPALAAFMHASIATLAPEMFTPLKQFFGDVHKRLGHRIDLRHLLAFDAWYRQEFDGNVAAPM